LAPAELERDAYSAANQHAAILPQNHSALLYIYAHMHETCQTKHMALLDPCTTRNYRTCIKPN